MNAIVKTVGARKLCGTFEALKDIDLESNRGVVICVIGLSSSGKSMLRCFNQLEVINDDALWTKGGNRLPGQKRYERSEPEIARRRLATGCFSALQPFSAQDGAGNVIEGPVQMLKHERK
ncbi:ABC-type polar amino acid transport system ATPase subunit [Bradyrhizobium japonicum]